MQTCPENTFQMLCFVFVRINSTVRSIAYEIHLLASIPRIKRLLSARTLYCDWCRQLNRLIVLWLTLYDRAMSVSTSPASRRAIASRR